MNDEMKIKTTCTSTFSFWKASLSKRYSAGVLKKLNRDIEEMLKLKDNQSNDLADFSFTITSDFFTKNIFRVNTVNTKTFVLLLSKNNPRSFISGNPVTLKTVLKDYNRNEFHHIFPKAYLRTKGYADNEINCLVNFCFMSKSDNNALGGNAPSVYRGKMPNKIDEILTSSFCSIDMFEDDYDKFKNSRVIKLIDKVNALIS